MQRPFFVALEGIDGSGKDTLAARLKEHFVEKHNLDVAVTEEPSQGPIGILIRKMLDGEVPVPRYDARRLRGRNSGAEHAVFPLQHGVHRAVTQVLLSRIFIGLHESFKRAAFRIVQFAFKKRTQQLFKIAGSGG